MYSATLPLFPPAQPVGRPDPDAEAVRRRAGVEYFELPIREILNRCDSARMPFVWTINPYRGCEFACTYCYARYTHGFFDLQGWQDFETKIFVKQEAAEALTKRLRRAALQGEPIAIGTATDPYQPAERHHGVTRSLLEVFARVEGLDLSITTKSPLILRDLELLAQLDRRHSLTIHMTVTTTDSALARRVEQHAPDPRARLRAVRRLAAEGLAVRINCMPILPGITDSEDSLRAVFAAADAAGAFDVIASPLFLKPAARARFWPWLEEEFPELLPLYRRLYAKRDYLTEEQKSQALKTFRWLKLECGFPRPVVGRA